MNTRRISTHLALILLALPMATLAAERSGVPPKVYLDLRPFKLTLPVDSRGRPTGKAAEISNAELIGNPGYESAYFYSDDDGAVVFNAPANGATTTPGEGSDNVRSELRELYKGKGTTEWTNTIGGTMTARCRVDAMPAAGGKAIIGQIHGIDSIFVLLIYDRASKSVQAKFYTYPGGSATKTFTLAKNVSLGSMIDYRIQWIGQSASVTVNGATVNMNSALIWNRKPVYFKAGAYGNTPGAGNGASEKTQVSFFDLKIQH